MTSSNNEQVAWTINSGTPYTVSGLRNGIAAGYSTNGNNLIVENIMMNDDRNNTEYRCVIITTQGTTTIIRESDPTILFVAGEYIYEHCNIPQYFEYLCQNHLSVEVVC